MIRSPKVGDAVILKARPALGEWIVESVVAGATVLHPDRVTIFQDHPVLPGRKVVEPREIERPRG